MEIASLRRWLLRLDHLAIVHFLLPKNRLKRNRRKRKRSILEAEFISSKLRIMNYRYNYQIKSSCDSSRYSALCLINLSARSAEYVDTYNHASSSWFAAALSPRTLSCPKTLLVTAPNMFSVVLVSKALRYRIASNTVPSVSCWQTLFLFFRV